MRIVPVVIGAALCVGSALAQEIHIPFSPPASAIYDVEETRTRISSAPGGANGTAVVRATLEIRGSGAPYQAMWTTNRIEAGGARIDAHSPGAAALLIGVPMQLTLDERGAPVAIQDWAGLRQRVFRLLEENTPQSERTGEWRQAHQAAERMFASMKPETAAQTLFPDVAVMSLCQGLRLEIGKSLQSDALTPNVLGGPPFRTIVTYELQSVDRQAGLGRILYTSAVDPQSMIASLRPTIERVVRETGRDMAEVERELAGATVTHNTRAQCVVDLGTGVTQLVTHRVTVDTGTQGLSTDQRAIMITRRP
jgi:hypothetical protein